MNTLKEMACLTVSIIAGLLMLFATNRIVPANYSLLQHFLVGVIVASAYLLTRKAIIKYMTD